MHNDINAAISSWWKRAWKNEDVAMVILLVFFFLGIVLTFGAHRKQFGAASLAASGFTSVILSQTIARTINRIHGTHYTKRMPLIWGVGMILIALGMLLD